MGKGPAVLLMAGAQRTPLKSPPCRAQPASPLNPPSHHSLLLLKVEVARQRQTCGMERAGSPLHPCTFPPCWGWALRALQRSLPLRLLLLGFRVLNGQMRFVCRKPRQRPSRGALEVQDLASPGGMYEEVRAGIGAQHTPLFMPTGNRRLTEP